MKRPWKTTGVRLFFSYSGPAALPLNRDRIGGPMVNFCPHNLREGFHALYALTRFSPRRTGPGMMERSIDAVFALWKPDQGWNAARLRDLGLNYQECQGFVTGEGRMLGRWSNTSVATGSRPALELALILKEKAIGEFSWPTAVTSPNDSSPATSHSVTCMMSSLAQLADLLGDDALLARVESVL